MADERRVNDQPKNFREAAQRRLMRDVIEAAAELSKGWMVMVIDDAALRVVSSLVGMYDVMEHRVTLIELLKRERQPLPEMEVIYLVAPSAETINLILKDFADPKRPQYGGVHLFFLSKVSDALVNKLGKDPNFLPRVRTFKEVNMNFLATEASAFHLDMPRVIPRLFRPRPDDVVIEEVANKLVSLCVTLNEYPHVRYNQASVVGNAIANLVQQGLNEFVARNESWWYYGGQGHTERDRGSLLILDRAEDPLTPFLHDQHYQAMVHDLLKTEDDLISIEPDKGGSSAIVGPTSSGGAGGPGASDKDKDKANPMAVKKKDQFLVNEADSLWVEFRHQHIARVSEQISERTKEFIAANAGADLTRKLGGNSKLSSTELALIVKSLPEYREMTGKLWAHYSITAEVLGRFTHLGGIEMAELEQAMATGADSDGKTNKDEKLLQMLEAMVQQLPSSGMTLTNKLRLIAIYIISQEGITEDVRRNLVALAGLTQRDQDTLIHLEAFGVAVQKTRGRTGGFWSSKKKGRKARTEASEYTDSRYVCSLKEVMEQLVEGELSVDAYPSVLPMPTREDKPVARSLRKPTAASSAAKKHVPANFTGPRAIVFVAGGVTYAEVRAAYEVMSQRNREVVIGGTSYLTPTQFVDALSKVGEADVGDALAAVGPGGSGATAVGRAMGGGGRA